MIFRADFCFSVFLHRILGELHFAANGREAIDAFKLALEEKSSYNLICLDIQIPEIDGRTVLKVIRECEVSSGIMYGDGVKGNHDHFTFR